MEGSIRMSVNRAVMGDGGSALPGSRFHRRRTGWPAFSAVAILAGMLIGVWPSSAGAVVPHSGPAPVIYSFAGRPQSFPYKGGAVKFTAKLKYATTCTLSASPRVKGLPVSVPCKSQSFARTVDIPKHTAPSRLTYTFMLHVRGKGGTVPSSNVVITVGGAPPPITFSPSKVNFGAEGVGIPSAPFTVTVTNNSASTQTLGSVSIAPIAGTDTGDFQVTPGNCSDAQVTHRQECKFTISFDPTGSGARSAQVYVLDSSWGALGTNGVLHIGGTGVFAVASTSATHLAFGNEGVFVTSNLDKVTLTNVHSVSLSIGMIGTQSANSTDFSVGSDNCENTLITKGKSCTFYVSFTPTGEGLRTSEVVIDDNTAGSTTTLPLTGTGVFALTTLSGSALSGSVLSFPPTTVGLSSSETVTILNRSNPPVTLRMGTGVFGGTNPSDFTWTPGSCTSVADQLLTGESCTFTVTFTPQLPVVRQATLVFADNTKVGFEELLLSGTGTS